jgi:hypothetical protein
MSSIDAVGSNFLEFEWKSGEYFIGQNIKGNGILPDPEFFKTSIDVFSIHDGFILYHIDFQCDAKKTQYSSIPLFHHSDYERSEIIFS